MLQTDVATASCTVMKKRKNPHAVALGRKGGKKGGPARAAKMTEEERSGSASARKAAKARLDGRAEIGLFRTFDTS